MGGKPPSQIFEGDAEHAEFGVFFDQKLLPLRSPRLRGESAFGSIYPNSKSAQTPTWSEGHRSGSSGAGRLKHSPEDLTFTDSETQM
jgi:hypothetical protein